MKRRKQLICMLLSIMLILTGMAGTVWAAEADETIGAVYMTEESEEVEVTEPETEIEETIAEETAEDETIEEETEAEETTKEDSEEEATEEETKTPETETPVEETETPEETEAPEDEFELLETGLVTYRTHAQTYGWMDWVSDGEIAGTFGEAKRLEAFNVMVDGPVPGGIEYRAHVQTYGWMDFVSDGAMCGTTGLKKRMEAVQIRLTGEMAVKYHVFYRLHVQNYGWLGWASDGQSAGTEGFALRVEAIQILVQEKGQPAPGSTEQAYIPNMKIKYRAHMQTYGWMDAAYDGGTIGIPDGGRRMEAFRLFLENKTTLTGGVEYQAHVQSYGWMDWTSNGINCGTTGQKKRIEALKIRLNGQAAVLFDIYYRCYRQDYGWTGWAKNGDPCGTTALAKRLEAMEVVLVEKGGAAPGSTEDTFINGSRYKWGVDVSAWEENIDWTKMKDAGCEFAMIRITTKNKDNDGFTLKEDPYFRKNLEGARANGIKVGGYVYNYGTTVEEIRAEAEFALQILDGTPMEYPIAYDMELPDVLTGNVQAYNEALADAFCETIKAGGYKTMVYGGAYKLTHSFDYSRISSKYDIWLARYIFGDKPVNFTDQAVRDQALTTGYLSEKYNNLTNVRIWQYTSKGHFDGVKGSFDLNVAYQPFY